jgi:hypothetical protein
MRSASLGARVFLPRCISENWFHALRQAQDGLSGVLHYTWTLPIITIDADSSACSVFIQREWFPRAKQADRAERAAGHYGNQGHRFRKRRDPPVLTRGVGHPSVWRRIPAYDQQLCHNRSGLICHADKFLADLPETHRRGIIGCCFRGLYALPFIKISTRWKGVAGFTRQPQ